MSAPHLASGENTWIHLSWSALRVFNHLAYRIVVSTRIYKTCILARPHSPNGPVTTPPAFWKQLSYILNLHSWERSPCIGNTIFALFINREFKQVRVSQLNRFRVSHNLSLHKGSSIFRVTMTSDNCSVIRHLLGASFHLFVRFRHVLCGDPIYQLFVW